MALGLLLVIIYSILTAALIYHDRVLSLLGAKISAYLLAVTILIISLCLRSSLFNDSFDYERFIYSFGFLILSIIGAICWVAIIDSFPVRIFWKSLRLNCYLLLFIAFISLTGYSPFFPDAAIPVIFFMETSHFALIFAPYLLTVLVFSNVKEKYILIALSFAYTFTAVPNLTLMVVLLLSLFVTFSFRVILLILALLAAFIFFKDNSFYFSERLSIHNVETSNLSTLVYQSSIERMQLAFHQSYGLGVGFQQFGIIGDQGLMMKKLSDLNVDGLNLLDGGLVASKFVGEFGIFAVVLLLFYLIYFYRYFKYLRFARLDLITVNNSKIIFFMAIYVMFAVQFFVRGTAYFSSGGFLFLASLIWLSSNNLDDAFGMTRLVRKSST